MLFYVILNEEETKIQNKKMWGKKGGLKQF